ncbi:peptidylprolyl isomerase [Oceanobacillus sp. CAU 1775]
MSKKLLWGIIVVLLITNIATLIFTDKDEVVVEDGDGQTVITDKEAVATIGEVEITYNDWMEALREERGEQQLKSMIDRQLVDQLAKEKNIEIHDKVIERDLAYLTSMQGPLTEEELAAEKEKWEKETIYRYQLEFLLTEDISIPEEELRSYFDEYEKQYNFVPAMQLSHILVPNMETAQRVYDELEAGASFELLAREHSIDDEASDAQGYLGFINTNSQFFPAGYEEVANELEPHSYSEPFVASNGVAIIYLHQKLPEIEFTFDEIKPYVKSELALREENLSLNTAPLWEASEIEWIYSNTN